MCSGSLAHSFGSPSASRNAFIQAIAAQRSSRSLGSMKRGAPAPARSRALMKLSLGSARLHAKQRSTKLGACSSAEGDTLREPRWRGRRGRAPWPGAAERSGGGAGAGGRRRLPQGRGEPGGPARGSSSSAVFAASWSPVVVVRPRGRCLWRGAGGLPRPRGSPRASRRDERRPGSAARSVGGKCEL